MVFLKRLSIVSMFVMCWSGMAMSDVHDVESMTEFEFVKAFSGKSFDYVRDALGEPMQVNVRENDSGKVEFLIYKDKVRVGSSDNYYKYTQIGIINGYVETIGNTNRSPE